MAFIKKILENVYFQLESDHMWSLTSEVILYLMKILRPHYHNRFINVYL